MKRTLLSLVGGTLLLILLVIIGLIIGKTISMEAAQVFTRWTLGWSLYWMYFPDIPDYSNVTTAIIVKSWGINIFVYSFLIYLLLTWRAIRKYRASYG